MNFKELFPLQVVINLDSRQDRLKVCMEEEFPKLGIIPVRKPGIVFTQAENAYSRGAIGCLLSHFDVLQAALILQTNVAIFEDDIHFKDGSLEILDRCTEELSGMEWDMFYGGGNILKPFYKVSDNLARLSHCQSTVFFAVNKKFIEKLLSYIDLKNISMPIDVIFADRVIPENKAFISVPMVGSQRKSFSDIEQRVVSYDDYLERRYEENIRDE